MKWSENYDEWDYATHMIEEKRIYRQAGRTGLSGMLLCIYKYKLEIRQKWCQSKEKIE